MPLPFAAASARPIDLLLVSRLVSYRALLRAANLLLIHVLAPSAAAPAADGDNT
jgi:hypothetical protein